MSSGNQNHQKGNKGLRRTLKTILVGDAGVGKTSLSQRYLTNQFSEDYRATIGVDFLSKDLEHKGNEYTLQVWDTAGQERFSSITTAFYRGSDSCVIVYDITRRKTFESIVNWIELFLETGEVNDEETFPFIVLGNKADKESKREVAKAYAEDWCKENGNLAFFEVSALNGDQIEEAFGYIVEQSVEQYLENNKEEEEFKRSGVELKPRKEHNDEVEDSDNEDQPNHKQNRGRGGKNKNCCAGR